MKDHGKQELTGPFFIKALGGIYPMYWHKEKRMFMGVEKTKEYLDQKDKKANETK